MLGSWKEETEYSKPGNLIFSQDGEKPDSDQQDGKKPLLPQIKRPQAHDNGLSRNKRQDNKHNQ